jgi:hypothetical protein
MNFALIMRYVIIAIIYIILFRIVRIMYLDLKGIRSNREGSQTDFALEVVDAPENIGIATGSLYPVHGVTNIGRKEDNHIILNDPYVSSYHARIYLEGADLYLKDLNSTNGTIKNGNKAVDAVELDYGDVIEIGRTAFKIVG